MKPTIADDAMLLRQLAGEKGRLGCAGHSRCRRGQGRYGAFGDQFRQ